MSASAKPAPWRACSSASPTDSPSSISISGVRMSASSIWFTQARGCPITPVQDPVELGHPSKDHAKAGLTFSQISRRLSQDGSAGRPPQAGWLLTSRSSPDCARATISSGVSTT